MMPITDLNWSVLTLEDISTEPLLAVLRQAEEPVSLAILTRAFIKDRLRYELQAQAYDPNRSYNSGDLIALANGQVVRLERVSSGYNPVQGNFQILTFADPNLPRLVAGLAKGSSAASAPSEDPQLVRKIEEQAREVFNGEAGPYLQSIVRQALQASELCAGFVDEWWLVEKLPYQADGEAIAFIQQLLKEQDSINAGGLQPVQSETLAELLWNVPVKDQKQVRLATFSLNWALSRQNELCYLRLGGWVLTEQLPDYQISRRPDIPHFESTLQGEAEQELRQSLEDDGQEKGSSEVSLGFDPWQDREAWQQKLAWPEAKVKLLGQHYIEGFLPLSKQGLSRVIPPSQNPIELAWFIFRQPDNNEGRFQVIIDYEKRVIIGGVPLHECLASQGILPGCYLYVHRRNDTEYDIYPKLLPQPVPIECKFAWVDDKGELVTEIDTVQVQYEHDPRYIVSETRLENMEALWKEATNLGLSFFDILVTHIFPKLAPQGQAIHWEKLWRATFDGYRMGSQQAIQRELRRQCFIQVGDGYYRFDPSRGYSFPPRRNKTRDRDRRKNTPEDKKPPPPEKLTWEKVATLEKKYLVPGPSPLGRILNYIGRIKEKKYTTLQCGPRDRNNLDQWTVYAMVGLELVQSLEESGGILQLTPGGEEVYPRLTTFDPFPEGEDTATAYQIRSQIVVQDEGLYHQLRDHLLSSPALQLLQTYLGSIELPLPLKDFYIQFAGFCNTEPVAVEHRLPGLLRVAEFCYLIDWDAQGRLILTSPASPVLATGDTTWAELAQLDTKYLSNGPCPIGYILNYIRRIKRHDYTPSIRGPQSGSSLNTWTVYAMMGLGLVQPREDEWHLTEAGELIYPRLSTFGIFEGAESQQVMLEIKAEILRRDPKLYYLLQEILLASPFLQELRDQLQAVEVLPDIRTAPLRLTHVYQKRLGRQLTGQRVIGLLRIAEFCGMIEWDQQGALKLLIKGQPDSLPDPAEQEQETIPVQEPTLVEVEKVKPTPPPSQSMPPPSRGGGARPHVPAARRDEMQNKALFSKYYLQTRLVRHPEWAEDPQPVLEGMRSLWQKASQYGDSWNEAQTEEEFIKPMLEQLGWAYIVQAKASKGGQMTRPDYALFANLVRRDEAYPYQGQDEPFYSRTLAIGEAKYWGRPLSQKDNSGRDTWKTQGNPSHQMVSYLVGTRVPWGILTNGQSWRLYSREVSSTASEFYEVDLKDIFEADSTTVPGETLDAFKRFWLFFRREAFVPDAQGKSFVQRINEESATYAREISDKLKELVFEEVMPEIAGGFVAYRYQQLGIQTETEESLKTIYQASLSLLYKLLFLLYAEARGLLPIMNPGYQEQSLTTMAQWAAERRDKALPLSTATHATLKYDALLALFHRIDQGDPSLGVPRYNGGLFNPANPDNQFLEKHKLSDRAVAYAVDILVRDAGQPVDYAYISVRNLGAIYEGLLENRLQVVDAATGRVELVNDKGERKASGSYYTPDYIVEYIVQHTLEPILGDREERFKAAMDRCVELRHQLQQMAAPATVRLRRQQLDEAEEEAREAFLSIKVLDPAMGSGHFLVNAVDYLTDGMIQRIEAYHAGQPEVPPEWNPIQKLIERVRADILAEMERQDIEVTPARLDDTALLTRLVMKRCIYGVDLNPMAVELAKLSLWLHSFTVGAPLSFLDHHLRWGNSLIGTEVRTVEREIQMTKTGQFGLFAGPFAGLLDLTGMMIRVAEQADATLADVHQSAEIFEQFQQELTPYKQILDLWVSQYFGNKQAREFLTLFGEDVLPALRGQLQVAAPYQAAIQQARTLWQEKRFFHWDLEFPEVFVDLHRRDWAENPGFDAVIGNPPYVSAWSMTNIDSDIRSSIVSLIPIQDGLSGHWDLYVPFLLKSYVLSREKGWFSFIIPNPFCREKYAMKTRKFLLENTWMKHIVSFGEENIFDEVSRHTVIPVFQKVEPNLDNVELLVDDPVKVTNATPETPTSNYSIQQAIFLKLPEYQLRYERKIEEFIILDKIDQLSIRLGDICYVNYGAQVSSREKNKFGKSDVVTYFPVGNAKRFFDGKNLSRYEIQWDGRYLDYRIQEMYGPRAPELFESPKVVVRDVTGANEKLVVAYDDNNLYCDHLVICATYYENIAGTELRADFEGFDRFLPPYPSLLYITGVLASRILTWYFREIFATGTLQGSYSHTYPQQIRAFPVRRISFTTPPAERIKLVTKGKDLAETLITSHQPLQWSVYGSSYFAFFIKDRLSVSPHEQTDVVHDLLAHLAEKMMEMNKEKQNHLSSFRLDLAGYLDEKLLGKLNRLYTPKKAPAEGGQNHEQKLATYQQAKKLAQAQLQGLAEQSLDLEDFWQLNQSQWMWLLRQNLGDVDNMSALVGVYKKYHSQLFPLMRRLHRTDWLIDQIVYQLYGLTEEEIRVVEGKG